MLLCEACFLKSSFQLKLQSWISTGENQGRFFSEKWDSTVSKLQSFAVYSVKSGEYLNNKFSVGQGQWQNS